ncbi:MAG: peptidase M3 [Bacteroidetes bacterium]|nr:MAG: peptidase M3 [Bacteroidota bacterium]
MKMKNLLLILLVGGFISCNTTTDNQNDVMNDNPLLSTWDTPFGTPPFDKIKNKHYKPAFVAAMDEQKDEIATIINNADEATFANTIEEFERSGSSYSRVERVFGAVNGANTNDSLQAIASEMAPIRSAHSDDINLNADLFKRVDAVYAQKESLGLNPEQMELLENTYKRFVRSGISLDEVAQTRLRAINGELAELSLQFGQNLLAETNATKVLVTNKEDLGNLPASLVAAAAKEAENNGEEGWMITLQRPSLNPFLEYSPNRELRKQLFMGYAMRGNNGNEQDNNDILAKMASLRAERANLKGYETHADYILSDNMAENPQRVYDFLDQVWAPAIKMAKKERNDLQAMMNKDGIDAEIMGWDWRYYTAKVRKERYDYDEEAMRPYFEFTAVREGAFMLANKLFGLTFTELDNVTTWHPDQQVFEVKEANGTHVGIIYMDFFARESKRGGAWMNSLRSQSKLDGEVTPIVTNNFNFPPPTENSPSLLSFSEASTLFHEFGHALHGLLSDVTYISLSGTNVPRDFVEFPSQVMENWMSDPEVLSLYAKHYQTGEIIPNELIEKISASGKFNQGFEKVEYMAASYLDMAYHTLKTTDLVNAKTFEIDEMKRIGLIEEIIPRYKSTYFNHIFGGDPSYSSGYYSYLWSEVLDADAFQAFKETSIFDQETAKKYRYMLSQGGTKQGMELYVEFRGREPEIDPLLKKLGFSE